MQWVITGVGELLIGRDGEEDVGRLHADLEFVEVVILQDAGMVESALDHRLGARLAVLLQEILLQRPGVDSDPHGAAVVLRRLHDLADPLGAADIARIDAQAGRTGLCSFDRSLIVKVDVRHDRDLGGPHDPGHRCRRLFVGAGHADDIDSRLFAAANLRDRRLGVRRQRVGHGLDRDRGVAAHRHGPDHHPPRLAAHDVAVRSDAHGRQCSGGRPAYPAGGLPRP